MRIEDVERWMACGMFLAFAAVLFTPTSALGAVTVDASGATMSVTGDGAADTIGLGGDPAVPNGQGTATAPGIALAPSADARCDVAGDTVTCTGTMTAPLTAFNADGGDGGDTLTIDTTLFWVAAGGAGDDTLIGSEDGYERLLGDAGNDQLFSRGATGPFLQGSGSFGGPDDDFLEGGPAADSLNGGAGTDEVLGGGGGDGLAGGSGGGDVVDGGAATDFLYEGGSDGMNDVIRGGTGVDTIFYSGAPGSGTPDAFSVNLTTGEGGRTNNGATTDSLAEIENVTTDEGADTLIGNEAANTLFGFDGNDRVVGGGGNDRLFGGVGDDRMEDRDGFRDEVDCGPGNDETILDELDVQSNCEPPASGMTAPGNSAPGTSAAPAPSPGDATSPAPPDMTAPRCTIGGLARRQTRKAFFRGVRFRQRCDERHRVKATLFARIRRIKGDRVLTSRAGDLVLGVRRLGLGTGRRAVGVPVARRLRQRLGRRFVARLRIDTFDASGNRRTAARTIRVRP